MVLRGTVLLAALFGVTGCASMRPVCGGQLRDVRVEVDADRNLVHLVPDITYFNPSARGKNQIGDDKLYFQTTPPDFFLIALPRFKLDEFDLPLFPVSKGQKRGTRQIVHTAAGDIELFYLAVSQEGFRGDRMELYEWPNEYVVPGAYWTFTRPSEILRGASDEGAEEVVLLAHAEPFVFECQLDPRTSIRSRTLRLSAWNLREVVRNYFHSGVTLSVLDARSLTPIEGAEILVQDHQLPTLRDAFVRPAYFDNLVQHDPSAFGLNLNAIARTSDRGEFQFSPHVSTSVRDSVEILVRHPQYDPFSGYLNFSEEGAIWEVLLPRIGTRVELDDAPELKARIRMKVRGGSDS